jgi:toxin ParE1/3/4
VTRRIELTAPASRDIAALLDWSEKHFGATARRHYEILLQTALVDLANDPERPGNAERVQLGAGRRVYHLRHSRKRARMAGGFVRTPRHFIVYRSTAPDLVVILRVLHDSIDLSRNVTTDPDKSGSSQAAAAAADVLR